MNNYQWAIAVVVVMLLILPFVFAFILVKWLRLRSRHKKVVADRDEAEAQAKRAIDAGQVLIAAHKENAARIAYLEARFAPLTDLDAEEIRLQSQISDHQRNISHLQDDYRVKKQVFDKLVSEIAIFDERLAFAELGIYEPHFDFTDSEQYKAAIGEVRDRQKALVGNDRAVIATKQWTVDGSVAKGKTMMDRNIRLTLRAYNNECEAAIANTRWNNVNAMEKRIVRAREQIDKLNASNALVVAGAYEKAKLEELYLTHEYREKLKQEKEERAELARLAKEEQKLLRDMEQAQESEQRYAALLEKARREATQAVGPQMDAINEKVRLLEKDLADAHAKFERAQAMAEKTRSGYVYIISNIGSFGHDIVKIGLTRRLDPMDRVRELGDASVPFTFDTHAIIYSDDAPTLERKLHAEFESTRVNAQNYRKEFFRASIDAVEAAVGRLAPSAPFFKDIEAQEYHETLSRRRRALETAMPNDILFPASI